MNTEKISEIAELGERRVRWTFYIFLRILLKGKNTTFELGDFFSKLKSVFELGIFLKSQMVAELGDFSQISNHATHLKYRVSDCD